MNADAKKPVESFDFEHMMSYIRFNIGCLRECTGHKFVSIAHRGAMFKCAHCGGEIEGYSFDLYLQGMRDGAAKLQAEQLQARLSSDNESNFGDLDDTNNIPPTASAA